MVAITMMNKVMNKIAGKIVLISLLLFIVCIPLGRGLLTKVNLVGRTGCVKSFLQKSK